MRFSAALQTTVDTAYPHWNAILCHSDYTKDDTLTVMSSNPGATPFVTQINVHKRLSVQLGIKAYRHQEQETSQEKPVVFELNSTPRAQELGHTVHHVPGSEHAPQELDAR
jgi:hypothetical protein